MIVASSYFSWWSGTDLPKSICSEPERGCLATPGLFLVSKLVKNAAKTCSPPELPDTPTGLCLPIAVSYIIIPKDNYGMLKIA